MIEVNGKSRTKLVKHRFLDHKIDPKTEFLIIGTFNPHTELHPVPKTPS